MCSPAYNTCWPTTSGYKESIQTLLSKCVCVCDWPKHDSSEQRLSIPRALPHGYTTALLALWRAPLLHTCPALLFPQCCPAHDNNKSTVLELAAADLRQYKHAKGLSVSENTQCVPQPFCRWSLHRWLSAERSSTTWCWFSAWPISVLLQCLCGLCSSSGPEYSRRSRCSVQSLPEGKAVLHGMTSKPC